MTTPEISYTVQPAAAMAFTIINRLYAQAQRSRTHYLTMEKARMEGACIASWDLENAKSNSVADLCSLGVFLRQWNKVVDGNATPDYIEELLETYDSMTRS